MGGLELLIILAIIALLFGAKQIPQLGRSLGSGIREFREGISEAAKDAAEERKEDEQEEEQPPLSGATATGELPRPDNKA